MKYFTSDWHLSHTLVRELNRNFIDNKEMDRTIIKNHLDVLKYGDDLYFLGDLTKNVKIAKKFLSDLKSRNIRFHWILGNHDKKIFKQLKHLVSSYDKMMDIYINNNFLFVLCHYPLVAYNQSHRNAINLYGHFHKNSHGTKQLDVRADGKKLNVNVEFNNYKPWSENDVIELMSKKRDNWDYIKAGQ